LGLNVGDKIYLSVPGGQDESDVNLLKELNGKRKKKEEKPDAIPAATLTVIPTSNH
jgi:hypothetical protein